MGAFAVHVPGGGHRGRAAFAAFTVYAFGDGSGTKTLQMAAKYGGFNNVNGNAPAPNTWPSPDLRLEWDTNNTCVPYNYFAASDGQVLEGSILTALSTILAKVASGTAASILAQPGQRREPGSAMFYPDQIFPPPTSADVTREVTWTGELQNLWYYVDPFLSNSSVREDTNYTGSGNHSFSLLNDYVVNFFFDGTNTDAMLMQDTNGDGAGDSGRSERGSVGGEEHLAGGQPSG